MRNALIAIILLFISTGSSFAITKKAIKPSELPTAITTDISVHFKLYVIEEAYKVNDKTIITFEVIINSAKDRIILYYNSDGKYIKRAIVPPKKVSKKG